MIDLFSAFFLLSYSRLMYQASLFLEYAKVSHVDTHGDWSLWYVLDYDSNIKYGSSMYITIAVVSLLIMFVFNILPALLHYSLFIPLKSSDLAFLNVDLTLYARVPSWINSMVAIETDLTEEKI